jgi:prepilin-type N-terminal cleavage/methylation domain-containing protein
MFKFLKQNKGLTLVELIVAMAISTIILTCLIVMFSAGVSAYNTSMDNFNKNTTAQVVIQRIQGLLKFANTVTINTANPTNPTTGNYVYTNNGVYTQQGGASAFTLPNGSNCTLTFTKNANSDKIIDLTVSINGYTVTTSIYLMSGTVTGSTGIAIGYS